MKLIKLLANLGYGSRKEMQRWVRTGWVTDADGALLRESDFPPHAQIRVRGEPLDPPAPLTIVLNKPVGYTCSTEDPGATIYDLLPERFAHRNPGLHSVGRLDKDTSGLLLMTDDGKLSHRIIHPKSHCAKIYQVLLDRPLAEDVGARFGSGEMMLQGEAKPLLPAGFEALGEREARVILHEGRYHQIRRMFAALGNHVVDLKRIAMGSFPLPDDLPEGDWRVMSDEEIAMLFRET
jgi:16S rRNA pseudouridine516 synthase